jgi:hypothetical protein
MVPWLLKNYLETHNPVYPFLSNIFGGDTFAPWRYDILRGENYGLRPKNMWGIPKLLWDLCVTERSSLSFQGPLFLACFPFALAAFFRERPRSFQVLWTFVVISCVLGLLVTRLTRYVLPAFAAFACFLAYGIEPYLTERSFLRRTGVLFIVLLCLLQQVTWAYLLIGNSFQPQNVLLGRESRFDYTNHYHSGMQPNPSNQMYLYMEKTFTRENKVLLWGDEKAYPLHVRHTYSGVYDRSALVRLSEESSKPEEIAAGLLKQGITHVMINLAEASRIAGYGVFSMSPKAFGVFCAFWEGHLKLVHVEYHSETGRDKNPIGLFEVHGETLPPQERFLQNIIAPIYEQNELARLGIKEPAALRAFYADRVKEWPNVIFLKQREIELRQNATK